MATLNDILQIKSFYSKGTVEALNVSFWKVIVAGVAVPDSMVAESFHYYFGSNIWAKWGQATALMYRTVVDNLTDIGSYGDYSDSVDGGKGDTGMPTFNAISVKQNVGSRLTRAGYKRLPFMTEALNDNGFLAMPAPDRLVLEEFYGEGAILPNPIDATPMITIVPIVVGRTLVVGSEPPEYELDLSKIQVVTSAVVQDKLTTQNTRKS